MRLYSEKATNNTRFEIVPYPDRQYDLSRTSPEYVIHGSRLRTFNCHENRRSISSSGV